MSIKQIIASACLAGWALAAPAPQLSGYNDASAGFPQTPEPLGTIATVFGPDSQIEAVETMPPSGTASGAAPPLVVSTPLTGPTSHGPFEGTPTTTGAVSTDVLAASIPALPPNPTATYYNYDGKLQKPQPAPFTPNGKL
jgi:hypothetical protein